MNKINLFDNNLTELTELDLKALCHLSGFKPEELEQLDISDNKLTNIDFIKENTHFINLNELWINNNQITDISNIQYLLNLEKLNISNLNLKDENKIIKILKTLYKLEKLICYNIFKNYTRKWLYEELTNIDEIFK